jgi:hypothetical protein
MDILKYHTFKTHVGEYAQELYNSIASDLSSQENNARIFRRWQELGYTINHLISPNTKNSKSMITPEEYAEQLIPCALALPKAQRDLIALDRDDFAKNDPKQKQIVDARRQPQSKLKDKRKGYLGFLNKQGLDGYLNKKVSQEKTPVEIREEAKTKFLKAAQFLKQQYGPSIGDDDLWIIGLQDMTNDIIATIHDKAPI